MLLVLGSGARNADVFVRAFDQQVAVIAADGTATLFCYGYTGSGKTHTILGYGGERSLHAIAPRWMRMQRRREK